MVAARVRAGISCASRCRLLLRTSVAQAKSPPCRIRTHLECVRCRQHRSPYSMLEIRNIPEFQSRRLAGNWSEPALQAGTAQRFHAAIWTCGESCARVKSKSSLVMGIVTVNGFAGPGEFCVNTILSERAAYDIVHDSSAKERKPAACLGSSDVKRASRITP